MDPKLDDYGAAYPGFLIMNPRLLDKVSLSVKRWLSWNKRPGRPTAKETWLCLLAF